jgi:predicted Na+-dependent transporter
MPSPRHHTHLPTSRIYILFILIILASTGGGVVYAVVKHDVSTGLSIATYVLTCLSLILALFAAGQWFGLKKPDSFSFAYDVVKNQVLSAPYASKVFGPEWALPTGKR